MRRSLSRLAILSRLFAANGRDISRNFVHATCTSYSTPSLFARHPALASVPSTSNATLRAFFSSGDKDEEKSQDANPSDSNNTSTSAHAHAHPTSTSTQEGVTDADAPDATLGVAQSPPNASDTAMTDLQEKVKALEAKVADDKTTMLRLLADMENLRTRTARQLDDTKKFAVQKLAKELLSVADDLNRALQHVPTEALESQGAKEDVDYYQQLETLATGMSMVERTLQNVLLGADVTREDPLGKRFDPNTMNALTQIPDPTKRANEVVNVIKMGYTLSGRVIRPAEVVVATGGEDDWPEEVEEGRK